MYAREHDFDDEIASAADAAGVPAWVVLSTVGSESSFDPRSLNSLDPGGGSRGLMGMTLSTARWLGYQGPPGDDQTRSGGLFDPSLNLQLGAEYLAYLRDRYPSARWDQVYGAYNYGSIRLASNGQLVNQSNVDRWGRIADHFNPLWRVEGAAEGSLLPPEDSPPDPPKPREG